MINQNKISHFQTEDSIIDQSYSLNSMLLAQYDVISLKHPQEEYWCIFTTNYQEKFESNFMRELIGFAGILRALLDVESISVPVKNKEYRFDQSVGELCINAKKEPLSFREACNKIIHANRYEIRFNYSDTHPLDNGENGYASIDKTYKNPIIITYGEYQKEKWNAELDFLKFINMSINLPEGK